MTISSTTRQAGPFTGNGIATSFPFTFKTFDTTDLVVIRTDTAGVDSTLALGTDYSVTLNSNQNVSPGGSIILVVALAVGFKMTATTDLANLQPTDLSNQGGFYPDVINESLDRATIQIQQNSNALNRSVKFPISDGSTDDILLPAKDARKGRVLAFDEVTGLPLAGPSIADLGTVSGNTANIGIVATNIDDVIIVADNISNVNTVAGISTNINTVAGNTANINATVANASNINAAVANTTNINTVAGNTTNINTVAGNTANINATVANATNINTVAGINANVTTVALISTNVTSVANNTTNVNTVATNIADVIAVADNNVDVSTVANNIAKIDAVGQDLNGLPITVDYGDLSPAVNPASPSGAIGAVYDHIDEIDTVSNSIAAVNNVAGNTTNVNTVADNDANITSAATNMAAIIAAPTEASNAASSASSALSSLNSFKGQYYGPLSSNPALDPLGNPVGVGDLYLNTTVPEMRVYDGAAWVAAYVSLGDALLSANNLSELTDASVARTNLGLSDMGSL
jgi:hypothetical protein